MKVLLIAYEYPPVLAAQALRWYYLGNELARYGVELDVLTPALPNIWGFYPVYVQGIQVHRCFPGPFVAFSGWLGSRQRGQRILPGRNPGSVSAPGQGQIPLSEQVYRLVRRGLDHVLMPDVRTEWLPFAWRAAKCLQKQRHYDLVICSHEPGVDLLLGLRAKREWGIPWVADLADPLLAPYTPSWRIRWDRALEATVCRSADAVLVTTDTVGASLADRHGIPRRLFTLIRQGFDAQGLADGVQSIPPWPRDRLVLLFTGTFYRGFRDPGPLIEALGLLDEVYAVFVGDMGPFASDLCRLGERVLLPGKLSHDVCLAWQQRADVLVNVGNTQDDQVPGKIYEYLGAGRPILHLTACFNDPVPALLTGLGRGRSVPLRASEVADAIIDLRSAWREGRLDASFDLSLETVRDFTWKASAERLYELMCQVIADSKWRLEP